MAASRGKIILLGEHAVVYGTGAIAAGITRGAEASARLARETTLQLDGHPIELREGELGRAVTALLQHLGAPAMELEATLHIPAGSGLGASAALGVALARAVAGALGVRGGEEAQDPAVVRDAVEAWERVFHGNPSGIDAAASAMGGCLYFKRGLPPEPLTVGRTLHLAVAVAGPPASTSRMVEGVAKLRSQHPEAVDQTLDAIGSLVASGRRCLQEGDLSGLGHLLDMNQRLLASLMVSTDELEAACRVARGTGALGAKLTGSGGGGCVLALSDGPAEAIVDAWQSRGLRAFATTIEATPSP